MPDSKSRILIVTERFYPEEFIINDLASEWAARGFKIDVLTQAPSYPFGSIFPGYSNSLFSESHWNSIRILRFLTITGYQRSLFLKLLNYLNFTLLGSIAAILMGNRYERIFVYHTGPLTLAIPAVLIGKLYKKDVTIWTQDVWPDTVYAYGFKKTRLLAAFLNGLVAFIYKNCGRIFVSCEGFKQKITPYAPGRPIYFFPNWPTITPGKKTTAKNVTLSDKFNFTFAGNIGKVQNLENVIRGFGIASAGNKDIQLNIIGDGSHLAQLKEIVREENIRSVIFWGRKKQSEMPGYFNASDVMVISLNDDPVFALTVPAKFQAYLAFGKPIFCVMKGEVRGIVEQHKTGLCADPEDLQEITEGFLKFYHLRTGGLQPFAEKSRILLETMYNRNRIIDSMTELISGSPSAAK